MATKKSGKMVVVDDSRRAKLAKPKPPVTKKGKKSGQSKKK